MVYKIFTWWSGRCSHILECYLSNYLQDIKCEACDNNILECFFLTICGISDLKHAAIIRFMWCKRASLRMKVQGKSTRSIEMGSKIRWNYFMNKISCNQIKILGRGKVGERNILGEVLQQVTKERGISLNSLECMFVYVAGSTWSRPNN